MVRVIVIVTVVRKFMLTITKMTVLMTTIRTTTITKMKINTDNKGLDPVTTAVWVEADLASDL